MIGNFFVIWIMNMLVVPSYAIGVYICRAGAIVWCQELVYEPHDCFVDEIRWHPLRGTYVIYTKDLNKSIQRKHDSREEMYLAY